MAKPYHFYVRTDRHQDVLVEHRRAVKQALDRALKGKKAHIHIHPTHVHVFARVQNEREFVSRIRDEIGKLDVKWDSKHYMIPISSTDPEYVSRLLKDLHREPGI